MEELDDSRITAIHETGHIVMGFFALGSMPRSVSIVPGSTERGSVGGLEAGGATKRDVLILLAGFVAVDILTGYEDDSGCEDDFQDAFNILAQLDAENDFNRLLSMVYKFLSYKRARMAVRVGADYLLEHPQLEGEAVYPLLDLLEKTMGRRFVRTHQERVRLATFAEGRG